MSDTKVWVLSENADYSNREFSSVIAVCEHKSRAQYLANIYAADNLEWRGEYPHFIAEDSKNNVTYVLEHWLVTSREGNED